MRQSYNQTMQTIEKQMLVVLDEEGEMLASDIRDRLELDQNQQVHYRADGALDEYVTTVRREEQPGAAAAARVYALTDAGREWVAEQSDDVSFTSLSDTEKEIERLNQQVSDLRGELKQATEWHREDAGHYSQLRQEVEEIENELRMVRTRASGAKGDAERLKDSLDDVETRLTGVQKQIDRLEDNVEDQSEKQRELVEHLQHLSEQVEQVEANQKQVERLRDRVEELEDSQPSSLLDLLFR